MKGQTRTRLCSAASHLLNDLSDPSAQDKGRGTQRREVDSRDRGQKMDGRKEGREVEEKTACLVTHLTLTD